MIAYRPDRPLISIHIPKTGGTSFRRNLEAWFGRKLYFHYLDEARDIKPPVVRLKAWWGSYRRDVCIHGHFNMNVGVGIETYYPEVEQFVTWLRDPVELQISLFHHHMKLNGAARYNQEGAIRTTTDIDEFFEKSRSPYFKEFPRRVTPENLFEQVEGRFIHIGVLEQLDASMQNIAAKLGRKVTGTHHENTTKRSHGPSESAIRRFQEKSALEYKLYEYACGLNR